jgi:hypothetical protein
MTKNLDCDAYRLEIFMYCVHYNKRNVPWSLRGLVK